MTRKRRDIYRGRFDPGFDASRDIDLQHLRELCGAEEIGGMEYNYFGSYCMNIVKILHNNAHFRGYPDDVKDDMMSEALVDMIKARRKFRGEEYPAPTAPFSYFFRIGYRSCLHVLDNYYKTRQNLFTPASQVGAGTCLMDSSEEFSDDIIEKAVNDWEAIELNLRCPTPGQSRTTTSNPPEGPCQE